MNNDQFQSCLRDLLVEFVGRKRADRLIASGEDARIIADSGINEDDQPDFWEKLHERLPIKAPWANDPKPTTTAGRLRETFFPSATYELPDVTIGELRGVVEAGAWPAGAVKRSKA